MRKIITLIVIFTPLALMGQSLAEIVKYHEIKITSSSIHLIQFNIIDTLNVSYVQETIDSYGRTSELRFYNSNHKLAYAGSGFYGGPIIKYFYGDDTIIETFFKEDSEYANDFKSSEVPYRFAYHLDENKQIDSVITRYKIDFDWTEESLDQTIKFLEVYKKYEAEKLNLTSVFGYKYAMGKLNGADPKIVK